MKLILLKPFLLAKTNGGEISMIERLRVFQSWGWDVKVKVALPESSRSFSETFLQEMKTPLKKDCYEVENLQCEVVFDSQFHPHDLSAQSAMENYFLSVLNSENPDLVWAHYTDFFSTTSAIRWNPKRTWIVLTDNEYPRLEALRPFPTIMEPYLHIQTVVVASRFMQQVVRKDLPWTRPFYLPNPLENLMPRPLKRKKAFWVFVNPTEVKGLEFMLELVQAVPDENFLFVGNWATPMPEKLPRNVETLPRQHNLISVFERAKGLLMPSVWQEAFGRLALEAMSAGVPVITSDRGALPHTVGSGGWIRPLNLSFWVEAIKLLPKEEEYLMTQGLKRVKAYQEETHKRWHALKKLFDTQFHGLPVLKLK